MTIALEFYYGEINQSSNLQHLGWYRGIRLWFLKARKVIVITEDSDSRMNAQ